MINDAPAHWALCYHTNSYSPRAKKWYYVGRIVKVDGRWFEVYWHHDLKTRGNSKQEVREAAQDAGINLIPGIFRSPKTVPHIAGEMEQA